MATTSQFVAPFSSSAASIPLIFHISSRYLYAVVFYYIRRVSPSYTKHLAFCVFARTVEWIWNLSVQLCFTRSSAAS